LRNEINDQIKKDDSAHGKDEELMQDFGGKDSRKIPLGIYRRRWEDSVKIDFRGIESGGWSRYSDNLRVRRPGFYSWQCKIFLFASSTPTVGPAQPAIQ
jgi:hypothetical protein